jgi:putative hydrolase of the HAD superfamily
MIRELLTVQLIAFDLDDTLYPEVEFVKSGFSAVAREVHNRFDVQDDFYGILWNLFLKGDNKETFNKALYKVGLKEDVQLIEELVYIYRNHTPHITLYSDASEILTLLQGKKKIGLITDGPVEMQKNKVQALRIENYFDLCVFTDAGGRNSWKPSPWGYQKMMEHFSLSGEYCAYVGDNSIKDFKGAKSLDWKTFKVVRNEGIYREVSGDAIHDAEYTLTKLTEIIKML